MYQIPVTVMLPITLVQTAEFDVEKVVLYFRIYPQLLKVGEHGSFWPAIGNLSFVWFGKNVTYVTLNSSTYT